jgi:CRP-like cAMP-binding protein
VRIFILCQGRAKLSTTSREGKTLMIRIAEPGEILGLHAVVTGGRYELTVETMQPCQLDYAGATTCRAFSKATLTPLSMLPSMLLSILLETVPMRMVWRARSGCHIRSQRGLPDSCLKRPPMAR